MNLTAGRAQAYAQAGLANVSREFPHDLRHTLTSSDEVIPRPSELHPAFYGSYDWHSCVEMHWMLVRLLRIAPNDVPVGDIRTTLDGVLTPEKLAAEAAYLAEHPGWERPYGWAWVLALAAELAASQDDQVRRWTTAIQPVVDVVVAGFLTWLPRQEHPVRHGNHPNAAFALSRALTYAGDSSAELSALIESTALSWFAEDADYPARFEASGADFLSPALTEAELMSQLLPTARFSRWLRRFLPGLADGKPTSLLEPVIISDPTDGQGAHLHGLNLSRAWCMRRIAQALPAADPRVGVLKAAADRHAAASLDAATGSNYMVEHWLAAYAVLLLS